MCQVDAIESEHAAHLFGDSERGYRNPSVRTLVKVANAFGVAVADLFK